MYMYIHMYIHYMYMYVHVYMLYMNIVHVLAVTNTGLNELQIAFVCRETLKVNLQ